jgi:hypothetical protein
MIQHFSLGVKMRYVRGEITSSNYYGSIMCVEMLP